MGVIAFVRQAFLDAQHYALAEKRASATTAKPAVMRSPYEPAFEAMQAALAGRQPVAFRGQSARDILRALDMAKSFKLDPIITDAREADQVAGDLKAANARVIFSLNYPTKPETLAPDADEPLRTLRMRANAPKIPAALRQSGRRVRVSNPPGSASRRTSSRMRRRRCRRACRATRRSRR